MKTEWVGVAANASSGRGRGRQRVDQLVNSLHRLGLETRVAWSPEARAEMVIDSDDDPSCRCLVAAGGDGTVAALINECPKKPITVLPAGTENLFAGHFQVRHSPAEVAQTIALGRILPMDLGLSVGRRFALMAGIGFDAEVVSRHHAARVGKAGRMRPTNRAAYVEPVLRASFEYQFPSLSITTNTGETLVGTTAFAFNLPRYALGLPIAPAAKGDDGLLDLVVFREPGPFQALHYLWMIFRGLHLHRDGITHRRISRMEITSAKTVPVQLDGDPGGVVTGGSTEPWTIEVLPGAVSVMVPEGYACKAATA